MGLLFVISVIFYASVLSMYCWRLVDTLLISVLCPIQTLQEVSV